jgi:hypothetical protein
VWRGRDALPRVRRGRLDVPENPLFPHSHVLCPRVHVLWTCNAGRAGAQPYRATRAPAQAERQTPIVLDAVRAAVGVAVLVTLSRYERDPEQAGGSGRVRSH